MTDRSEELEQATLRGRAAAFRIILNQCAGELYAIHGDQTATLAWATRTISEAHELLDALARKIDEDLGTPNMYLVDRIRRLAALMEEAP